MGGLGGTAAPPQPGVEVGRGPVWRVWPALGRTWFEALVTRVQHNIVGLPYKYCYGELHKKLDRSDSPILSHI